MADTPTSTPKRKRGAETSITPIVFNFDLSRTSSAEDGGNSPRSKVAHKFRGLAIESDGGGGGGVSPDDDGESLYPASKRIKPDEVMREATTETVVEKKQTTIPEPEVVAAAAAATTAGGTLKPPDNLPEGSLQRAYPSINRLSESKSRSKDRSGTPPPGVKKQTSSDSSSDDAEEVMEIVDPVRAALTWREDEITIYDPEDEDDDGTGINGVGFKPTPALAQARVMKRRQQLAEYRKREENEARAKRSQRRRGAHGTTSSPEQAEGRRKVRFMDNDKPTFIATKS